MSKTRATLALIVLAISTYVALATWNLKYPGPYGDEFFQAPAAVYLLTGQDTRLGFGVTLGGQYFPVLAGEYLGSLRSYVVLPAFYLLGIRVTSHRLALIIVTVAGLILTALLAWSALGDGAALVAVWLLATDPTLILSTRADLGPAAIPFLIRMGVYYLLWRWWVSRGREVSSLLGAAFLCGLGVYDKTNFLWIVIALGCLAVAVYLWSRFRGVELVSTSWRHVVWVLLALFVSSSPLWFFNLKHGWITFRLATLPGEPFSVRLLLQRIPFRTEALLTMFNSGGLADWMSGEEIRGFLGPMRSLLLPLTVFAILGLIIVAVRYRRIAPLVIPAVGAMLLGQMYLTPRPIWIHHFIMVYPLPHLAIGLVAAMIFAAKQNSTRLLRPVALLLVCLAIALNLMTMVRFHQALSRTGGSLTWSDSIYSLGDQLNKDFSDRTIQLLDWGMWSQLVVLSEGRLDMREPFYELSAASDAVARLSALASDSRNVFVLHGEGAVQFDKIEGQLQQAVSNSGLKLRNETQVKDRVGRVVFRILEFD
jgi:hypothetical protein